MAARALILTLTLSPTPTPIPNRAPDPTPTPILTGVHSHQEHLYALIAGAKAAGVPRTLLHVCMDGRDTPPTSGGGYMAALEAKLAELSYGEISTISGRYYAMDRDKRWAPHTLPTRHPLPTRQPLTMLHSCCTPHTCGRRPLATPRLTTPRLTTPRLATPRLATPRLTTPRHAPPRLARWERVQLAYDVMCRGPGECETVAAGGVTAIIEARHAAEENDEFIKPTGLLADGGLADGDVFVSFNYRADRAREMFECVSVKPLPSITRA